MTMKMSQSMHLERPCFEGWVGKRVKPLASQIKGELKGFFISPVLCQMKISFFISSDVPFLYVH